MTITQLLAIYHHAPLQTGPVEQRPLSPAEAAGAQVEEHGLRVALLMAQSRAEYLPASAGFEMQVWQVLQETREG